MPIRATRFHASALVWLVLFLNAWMLNAGMPAGAQAKSEERNPARPGAEYSGMYSFLSDGEFVQLTVEDQGHVIGFVSRYADAAHEGGFINHFFESGQLNGNQVAFTTKNVDGISFEFRGTIERGEGKSRSDEAYYVLKGTVVEHTTQEAKKTSSRSVEVALKSFPQDLAPPQAEQK
jgi:hypothetical protein